MEYQIDQKLYEKIEEMLQKKERAVIAIDGGAGSGKTTLATALAIAFDGTVIHMDDFFLRPEQRTPERLAEAGGNFDRERFFEEVILPLKHGGAFSYQRFDCHTMTLGERIEVPTKKLIIVEGSYSQHPLFEGYYDLCVFLSISVAKQRSRILERNGDMSDMFFSRWIPMENRYFQTFAIERNADIVISV